MVVYHLHILCHSKWGPKYLNQHLSNLTVIYSLVFQVDLILLCKDILEPGNGL